MEPLTHQHAPVGERHQCTSLCIHVWTLKSQYQPFLAGAWHMRHDPQNRQTSVEWTHVCLEPVEGVEGRGISSRPKKRLNKDCMLVHLWTLAFDLQIILGKRWDALPDVSVLRAGKIKKKCHNTGRFTGVQAFMNYCTFLTHVTYKSSLKKNKTKRTLVEYGSGH